MKNNSNSIIYFSVIKIAVRCECFRENEISGTFRIPEFGFSFMGMGIHSEGMGKLL